jgi:hypothetical protein
MARRNKICFIQERIFFAYFELVCLEHSYIIQRLRPLGYLISHPPRWDDNTMFLLQEYYYRREKCRRFSIDLGFRVVNKSGHKYVGIHRS